MSAEQALPDRLEVVRDFVNTLDVELGTDSLGAPEDLRSWCAERDLLGPLEILGEADRRRALEVREALRSMLRANAGETPQEDALGVLNRVARNARLIVRFDARGGAALEPDSVGMEGAIGRILAIAYTAASQGTWARLKACGEHTCLWAFYDHSKNRSRTWCSMAVCGNRSKTRNYRRRHAPASTGAAPGTA
jgi:predicted RNA-binding Zn ribbon-like protein